MLSLVREDLIASPPQELLWSSGVEDLITTVRACCGSREGLHEKRGSRHRERGSQLLMGWAVSEQHIKQAQRIDKEYPNYCLTYPTGIHAVYVSDTYPIRDTSYLAISG